MRKLFILFTLVMMSLSPSAFAQTGLEADITSAVTESGADSAYLELISSESNVLSQDQKDALSALGAEAGAAFLNAVANGSSFSDAAVIAVTTTGASSTAANSLVASLGTSSSNSSGQTTTGQLANNLNDSGEESGELQTETAAGPTTGAGTGTTTAPVGGGTNGGGAGGGGVTASGN